jgi:hypothetical protein
MIGFLSSCWAQNTTDINRCPKTIGVLSPDARVNSTGMRSLRWQGEEKDWYLTTTLNDTRSPLLTATMHDFQGYISAQWV